ncbi:MAG: hypothetical protein ACR2PF_14200, partial [Rhizobiaceae bacterium]
MALMIPRLVLPKPGGFALGNDIAIFGAVMLPSLLAPLNRLSPLEPLAFISKAIIAISHLILRVEAGPPQT